MLVFSVWGEPVPQPRHRATIGYRGRARVPYPKIYLPEDHPVHTFKARVRHAAREAGAVVLRGPVRVSLLFVLSGAAVNWWHVATPDVDNLQKAVMDALTGVCWDDDRQVAEMLARKMTVVPDSWPAFAQPGVHVLLRSLRDATAYGASAASAWHEILASASPKQG